MAHRANSYEASESKASCSENERLTGFSTPTSVRKNSVQSAGFLFFYLKKACLLSNNSPCRPGKYSGKSLDARALR